MKKIVIFLLLFCLVLLSVHSSVTYVQSSCPSLLKPHDRKLIIATCETRLNEKDLVDLRLWNISSRRLRDVGVEMVNPCRGADWKELGVLVKPMYYLQMLESYQQRYSAQTLNQLYFLLTDSDTFWSARNLDHIWRNFDCARNGKHLLISSEMSCWVGKFCSREDIQRWYGDTSRFPTISPFLNSGVMMGRVDKLIAMFQHILTHNDSYYVTKGKRKLYFEDQFATTNYAMLVAPNEVALDYHQYISASLFYAKPEPPEDYPKRDFKMQFICMDLNRTVSYHCHNYEQVLFGEGHFALNEKCYPRRVITETMSVKEELRGLASDPVIWHSNGLNKKMYRDFFHSAVKCSRNQKGYMHD